MSKKQAGRRVFTVSTLRYHVIAAFLLLIGLSVQQAFFASTAILLILGLALTFLSVQWSARTLRTEIHTRSGKVTRGETVPISVRVQHACPLPLGGMMLMMDTGSGSQDVMLQGASRSTVYDTDICANHVGVINPGLEAVEIVDLINLHAAHIPVSASSGELVVLPRTFRMAPLHYAPADPGLGTMARATEDLTDPMDVRAYQPGDPMKKIHWKLSARKREAVIRRFEEPVEPEALLLMDASEPPTAFHRDTLLESAASLFSQESAAGRNVRLPLYGSRPTELTERMGMPLVLESLARAELTETDRFERILEIEAQRLRLCGSVAVLTCRLTGSLADTLIRMRRLGPPIRVFLIVTDPDDPALLPCISQLQQGDVEVGYVQCEDQKNGR